MGAGLARLSLCYRALDPLRDRTITATVRRLPCPPTFGHHCRIERFRPERAVRRQIEGLAHKNDLVVLLSSNGEESIDPAAQVARERAIITLALMEMGAENFGLEFDRRW